MVMYRKVCLLPTTTERAQRLWWLAADDPAWPRDLTPLDTWVHHVDASTIAECLGRGALRTIEADGETAGFVSKSLPDASFLPIGTHAMESGTFLLPQYRGTGLHEWVKRLWLAEMFDEDGVDYCLFVIAKSNPRAVRALHRLGLPVTVSTPEKEGAFMPLAKRKSWEHGTPCQVYALSDRDFRQWLRRHHSL